MNQIHHRRFADPPAFLVGRDADGHWLAIETHGRGGGIFADRSAALRYAAAETAHRPRAVRMTARRLRLL